MMRCVIVDDEPLALDIIETYLQQIKDTQVLARFTDAVEAFTYLQHTPVDLVFLDLNMPVLNGMELLKNFSQRPAIIVTTAYRDFAVESFELDVLDYLVKPFSFPRFLKAVNKLVTPKLSNNIELTEKKPMPENLWLKVDKKMVSIAPRDIYYVQSLKDYVRVVTVNQKMIIYHTLQALMDKLPADEFLRIHKSYAVQIAKIESIEGNAIRIQNAILPIGRNFRSSLINLYKLNNAHDRN
ncbi:MAG: LytR/AlgR family response regulator transcription factor [Cytophagales bacterium]